MRVALALLLALLLHGSLFLVLAEAQDGEQLPPGTGYGTDATVSAMAEEKPKLEKLSPALRLHLASSETNLTGLAVSPSAGQTGGGDSYLGRIRAYLNAQAQRLGGDLPPGTVEVRFQIGVAGEVSGIQLSASSGHAELDAAALRLLAHSAPLPIPPEPMRLRVPIQFIAQ